MGAAAGTARAVGAAIACALAVAPVRAADIKLPQGPGVNLVYAKCRTCHDLQYVVDAKGLLPAQWQAVVASMHDYGLTSSKDEDKTLVSYLSTYLGTHPPPATTANATASNGPRDGKTLYAENCATCHGADGRGQPGLIPPLAGNADLRHEGLPMTVVLHGLEGPIRVEGEAFDGAMPPFGHLGDDDVAAIVNYVKGAWGNQVQPQVTPAQVEARRGKAMSPSDVHAFRSTLVAAR